MGSTKVLWRVQVRLSRSHAWRNKGLFETRSAARIRAKSYRENFVTENWPSGQSFVPFGFGNTRVVRYVRGEK